MLSIIVAMGNNNAIGKDNKLLWHLPNDLNHFRKLTTGHSIIMGRKTFESLPKILPGRKHLVLTKDHEFTVDHDQVSIFNSMDQLLGSLNTQLEYFVIGGGQIYQQFLPYINKLYLTIVDHKFEADTFFPEIDYRNWKKLSCESGTQDEKNTWKHKFVTYKRVI